MGNCGNSIRAAKEYNKSNEQIIIPQAIIDKKDRDYIITIPVSDFEEIDQHITKVSKSICKIEIETSKGTKKGTGFLMKFLISSEMFFYCLISNAHVLTNGTIRKNRNIIIYFDSEYEVRNIKLDPQKRYIKNFKDFGLDITAVEIIEEDDISKDYYLLPENSSLHNRLLNSQIYIPQYMKGKNLVYARGKVTNINKYEITHLANTDQGSSGSPIFLEKTVRVIGIHKGSNLEKTENYGDIIYPAIVEITNDFEKKQNNGKYEDGKFIWEDGKYYLGQFKNNLPNGKGIKYNSNGNIMYEGDFINGKYEGNGKCIFENGQYYIGQWKNGLKNGKGTLYYKNGDVLYEGDFVNDAAEGNGISLVPDGEYYIGQMKKGLRNGKGIEYYANGNIRYEGDFVNNRYEGHGKNILRNGDYYIGQWKNGVRNGKGILYYKNGNIILMINLKGMENIFGKMANIIQDNGKMV